MSKSELVIIFCLAITVTFGLERVRKDVGDSDFMFELPDVAVVFDDKNVAFQLEAFRSSKNEDAFRNNEIHKLNWMSFGYPNIVEKASTNGTTRSFYFTSEMVYFFIDMLNSNHRRAIVDEISRKFKIKVLENQILALPLSAFKCSTSYYIGGVKTVLEGKVDDLRQYPLKLEFWAPVGTPERIVFEKVLNDPKLVGDLLFKCDLESIGKQTLQNTLTISLSQLNKLNIQEKLFGDASSAYVTREQLSNLAAELSYSLDIVEEYQMPETQFTEQFIQEIVKLTSESSGFQKVSIDDALSSLSKYSLNFDGDLKPDVIKSDMGRKLIIAQKGEHKFIKVDNTSTDGETNDLKTQTDISAGLKIKGFGLDTSTSIATEKHNEWENSKKTVAEQLNELNTNDTNQIEWKIEGERLVPKSLKVARLNKANFDNKITFNRIRKNSTKAMFTRKIVLQKKQYKNTISKPKFPLFGSVVAIANQTILKSFNDDGIGMNDYIGWYLCNGENGTPNLKGKFLVGYNLTDNEYKFGVYGGLNKVQLSVYEMPSHNHIDKGHFHDINIETSFEANHFHVYNDVFHPEHSSMSLGVSLVGVPGSLGSYGTDRDNVGLQMSRETFPAGSHYHTLNGYTDFSKYTIQVEGKYEAHENRPPYSVIAYIVYLG